MERHDQSIQGPKLHPTKNQRIGNSLDAKYKYLELTVSDITRLTESCPDLEELWLQFKRSGGSHSTRLLVASQIFISWSSTSIYPGLLLRGVRGEDVDRNILCEAFINAAIDEALARSVWNLILSNQPSRRLRNLCLAPSGTPYFRRPEAYLLSEFARSLLARMTG